MTQEGSVAAYLARLPAERRAMVAAMRRVIRRHLPKGYRETAKRAHISLYLMAAYGNRELTRRLQDGFRRAGKRLDMGKACIRFRTLDDLDLQAIAEVIASTPLERYVARAEAVRTRKR